MKFVGQERAIFNLVSDILKPSIGDVYCQKCERWLFADDFATDKSRPTGRFPYCKDCKALYQRKVWESTCQAKKKAHSERNRLYKLAHPIQTRSSNLRYHRLKTISQAISEGKTVALIEVACDNPKAWRSGSVIFPNKSSARCGGKALQRRQIQDFVDGDTQRDSGDNDNISKFR